MKAPQFQNLYRFALALLLAGSVLAAGVSLPAGATSDSALAASQTIPPASTCTGSTCG